MRKSFLAQGGNPPTTDWSDRRRASEPVFSFSANPTRSDAPRGMPVLLHSGTLQDEATESGFSQPCCKEKVDNWSTLSGKTDEASVSNPPRIPEEVTLFPLDDDPEMSIVTFRSFSVGFLQAVVGAIVGQLFIYKPVLVFLQPLFLQISAMIFGRALALIPGPRWWNPGPFTMKENVFATLMSTSSRTSAFSIYMLATEDLFFDKKSSFLTSMAVLLSTQLIGYGWAGFLQPILVFPAHAVFPQVLPSVALFHTFFHAGKNSHSQLKFFKKAFIAIFIYEVFPTYLMPALQSLSIFCLAFPKSSVVTNFFGGVRPYEGLGLFEISLDWVLVGAGGPLFTPLFALVHQLAATVLSSIFFWLAYSQSWFGYGMKEGFPFFSVSIFNPNGTVYSVKNILNADGSANQTKIDSIGIPSYTATNVLTQILHSLSISAAFSHVILYNWDLISGLIKKTSHDTPIDPHRLVVRKSYNDVPLGWFSGILVVGIALALVTGVSQSDIPLHGLVVAIALSSLLALGVGFISAISGYYLMLNPVSQMIGGLLFPGNAFGNMWFATYSSTSVSQALNMLSDLKLGQYMYMPPATVVAAQGSGMFVGAFVNYVVMRSMIGSQRDALLLPGGDGIYSGAALQNYGVSAVTWGTLSHKLYTAGQKYVAVPAAFGVGFLLPIPFFLANKIWPKSILAKINIPLLTGIIATEGLGVSAGRFTFMLFGFLSQFWARRYHHEAFQKYNYVLSAALDGGTQILILFMAATLQGGFGFQADFPTYFLNPSSKIPRDYCYVPSSGS